jgi:hypothetical protein
VPFRVFVGMTCDNPVASYREYQVKSYMGCLLKIFFDFIVGKNLWPQK